MATEKELQPTRWEEDILRKDFIPRPHPLPAPNVGIFDSPYVCFPRINAQWLSHIIGMIEVLLAPDSWTGSDTEVWAAQQEIEKLLNVLKNPCSQEETVQFRQNGCVLEVSTNGVDWTPIFDSSMCGIGEPGKDGREIQLQAVEVTPGCDLIQQRYEGDSEWVDLLEVCDGTPGANGREIELQTVDSATLGCKDIQYRYSGDAEWLSLATICNGEDGADGLDGADGEPGQQGPAGECTDCGDGGVGQQPEIEPEPAGVADRACNLATGLQEFLNAKFDDHAGFLKAQFQAALIIYDVIENFIESFPVIITGFITAVADFVQSVESTDIDELRRLNGILETQEEMRCVLYCAFKRYDGQEIGQSELESVVLGDLAQWLNDRGFEGPLITAYGPIMALWLQALNYNDIMRRMNIWVNKPGSCELCDECPSDCEEIEKLWSFDELSAEYTILNGTQGGGQINGRIGAYSPDTSLYPSLVGQPIASACTAYVRLEIDALVNSFRMRFKGRRSTASSAAWALYIYCYNADNSLMFGSRLGLSANYANDQEHEIIVDVPGTEAQCIHHAVVIAGFGSSTTTVSYVNLLEVESLLT